MCAQQGGKINGLSHICDLQRRSWMPLAGSTIFTSQQRLIPCGPSDPRLVMRKYFSWHNTADFCRGNSTIGLEKVLQVRTGPDGEPDVISGWAYEDPAFGPFCF